MRGTVKWFAKEKGFGFISDGKDDFFVHFKDIDMPGYKQLEPGQFVDFTTTKGPKGMQATNVKVVRESQGSAKAVPWEQQP